METVTPIIIGILAIEPVMEIPQTANIPKCLWIHTQTTGPRLALQISRNAARELMEALQKYEQVHSFQ